MMVDDGWLRSSYRSLGPAQDDLAILERWAQEAAEIEQRSSRRIESLYRDFCGGIQSAEADVVSGLLEASRIENERNDAVLSSFEEAASLLSDSARAVVNSHVDNDLLSGISYIHWDYESLLADVGPELVAAQLRMTCDFRATHSDDEIRELAERSRAQERSRGLLDSAGDTAQQGTGAATLESNEP